MLVRMLILWLLSEGPAHGYRILRTLRDSSLRFWFDVEDAQVYSSLRTLAKLGFVRRRGRERVGLRPARTSFAVTAAGRAHFRELLRRAWLELPPAGEPVQLALAAASELDAEEVEDLARRRAALLAARQRTLRALVRSAPAAAMARRQEALARAERRFFRSYEGGTR